MSSPRFPATWPASDAFLENEAVAPSVLFPEMGYRIEALARRR